MPPKNSRKALRPVIIPIGPSIAYVPLTSGYYALIESDDAAWAGQWNWFALQAGRPGCRYIAAARVESIDGHRIIFLMHTALLGLGKGDKTADHIILGNMLDNRRNNLRPATRCDQARNKRTYRNNTSGYKGVWWHKDVGKWWAYIRVEGKTKSLKFHSTKELAYAAYCEAAARYHGDFAGI